MTVREPWFETLERLRHRIPFWWWLTYDALVGVVIAVGVPAWSAAMWLGYTVLGIAVVIDVAEFLVKRPSARAKLALPATLCDVCERGADACQYCDGMDRGDWEAICDCGLYDFGRHLTTCEDRRGYRYVIASDHEAAYQLQTSQEGSEGSP